MPLSINQFNLVIVFLYVLAHGIRGSSYTPCIFVYRVGTPTKLRKLLVVLFPAFLGIIVHNFTCLALQMFATKRKCFSVIHRRKTVKFEGSCSRKKIVNT